MNLDISRTTLGIAAGIAGTIFLSYCIYFDKKRRNDPEYKKKVRERKLNTQLHNFDVLFHFNICLTINFHFYCSNFVDFLFSIS